MNFPIYIAKRYLVAKKSRNVINIISLIAIVGVAIGTMALIVVLSVFNGFDNLVKSLFNSFDPDLKILPATGKVFIPGDSLMSRIKSTEGVYFVSEVLEENALLRYGDKQHIATIKGVDDNFEHVSGIDSMIFDGKFVLHDDGWDYAIVGMGISYYLSIGLNFIEPLHIYVPKRTSRVSLNPEQAFNRKYIYASGIYRIEQDIDSRFVILPLSFTRELLDYDLEISALEIKVAPGFDVKKVQNSLSQVLGNDLDIKDRYQQKEFFYKIMQTEKWAIYFILSFILVIASFNIIGSLTMLILDKKSDIAILGSMGADAASIRKIFLFEGWLIAGVGALIGLLLGLLICWVQIQFGVIKLQGAGSFVIDAYPVSIKLVDFILIFLTVSGIGFLASWYPVRFITKNHFIEFSEL